MRQLKQFRSMQDVYTPAAAVMLAQTEEAQQHLPEAKRVQPEVEHQELWLPSALPANHRMHSCRAGLIDIETRLRQAQCLDALEKIRTLQRGRLSFIGFRNRNVRGQNPTTRAADTINRIEDKSKALAVKYRATRRALFDLMGPGDWERELKELNDGDLTTPDGTEISIEDPNEEIGPDGRLLSKKRRIALERGLGEGRRVVSWIWTMKGSAGNGEDNELNEGKSMSVQYIQVLSLSIALRVEWAKARARSLRWSEEVMLLKEEMRRVRKTLEWKASWWDDRQEGWLGLDAAASEGVKAYAARQARIQRDLHVRFTRLWDQPLVPFVREEDSGEGSTMVLDPVVEAFFEDEE